MFKLPEDLSELDVDELQTLHEEGLTAARDIAEKSDDDLTDEDLGQIESIMTALDTITGEVEARTAALTERTERLAAVRGKVQAAGEAATEEEPEEVPAEDDEEEEPETDKPSRKAEEAKEPVAASARRTPVGAVARRAPAVTIQDPEPEQTVDPVQLIAAANVPGFESGNVLANLTEVAKAFEARARGFKGQPASREERFERYGVARIRKPEHEFTIDAQGAEEQMAVINAAAKEARLPKGGLVAAGGWCAPSETLYDFCSWETVSGILSIPEIQIRRGGINFTKGPDYAALAATWGFLQTEAQAEAGTAKTCYEIACPPFTEVRLDAIGFCVKNGILTNVGYPELTRRVLEIGAVAHAHKVNAQVIGRIATSLGTAVNSTELGGTTSDVLDAISLNAEVIRYTYSLAPNATIEAVLPVWAKGVIREDLARRTGIDMLAVSDGQINSFFGARNIAPQFVYDYQPLPVAANSGQTWPTTLEVLLYPAGAFVKGTTDVIDLDTVYDSTGLSTNTYTAAFFEEGLLVANTCGGGRKVAIALAAPAGRSGAADVTTLAAP